MKMKIPENAIVCIACNGEGFIIHQTTCYAIKCKHCFGKGYHEKHTPKTYKAMTNANNLFKDSI